MKKKISFSVSFNTWQVQKVKKQPIQIVITQQHIDELRKYLGEENLRYFRHLKGLTGDVFPVLSLNFSKKGIPAHPVGLREGMQIRNWMRINFSEFRELSQNKIERLAEKLVEKAIN